MNSSDNNNGLYYLIVGVLTCLTTLIVTWLNKKYNNRVKPRTTAQAGYTEWVAYLEREITALKDENKNLNGRINGLEQKVYEKDTIITRMRSKLLELSRKYNEDVSNII